MRYTTLPFCTLVFLLAGCESSSPPRTMDQVGEDNLIQVGELCRHFQFTKQKPPAKLDDLNTVRGLGGNGYEALRTGNIVLLYGATLPDTDEDPGHADSREVLAYHKEVPESGGYVLLLNRTVKKMTAEEFKAAPRPPGSKEAAPEPAAKQ